MSVLLNEIKKIHPKTADQLRKANCVTDSDIRNLTRVDLNELLPGVENLTIRKTIFDKIHKQKPVGVLLEELKHFIPHESLKDALTNNGVLVDYLHILKDLKNQMNHVQDFLDAHIGVLEEINSQPEKGRDKGFRSSGSNEPLSTPKSGSSASDDQMRNWQVLDHPPKNTSSGGPNTNSAVASGAESDYGQGNQQKLQVFRSTSGSKNRGSVHAPVPKTRVTVRYKEVISGRTFGADQQLLDKVKDSTLQKDRFLLNLEQSTSDEDADVIIVFCPIVSRVGTDVDAAMKMVTDNRPVILVLMHHVREPKPVTSVRTWSNQANVDLHVNVFYHETINGLLTCPQNSDAFSKVGQELLKRSRQTAEDEIWNAKTEANERDNSESNASTSGVNKASDGRSMLSKILGH